MLEGNLHLCMFIMDRVCYNREQIKDSIQIGLEQGGRMYADL